MVEVDAALNRLDFCAGVLDVIISAGEVSGVGTCIYTGNDSAPDLVNLFPDIQTGYIYGQSEEIYLQGGITVRTEIGRFDWSWSAQRDSDDLITGEITGRSDVEWNATALQIRGQGWFEASLYEGSRSD